jgi:hypothetical protein
MAPLEASVLAAAAAMAAQMEELIGHHDASTWCFGWLAEQ